MKVWVVSRYRHHNEDVEILRVCSSVEKLIQFVKPYYDFRFYNENDRRERMETYGFKTWDEYVWWSMTDGVLELDNKYDDILKWESFELD